MSWGAVIVGGVSLVSGIIQSSAARKREKKAQKQLEAMKSPVYTPNKGIQDYYNKALERYNVDTNKEANRGLTTGIDALQSRRAALGGISNLVQGHMDATERGQGQALGQLGQAAGAQGVEGMNEFNINQYQPFERQYNLTSLRAGAAANTVNAGISNMQGGANQIWQAQMLNNMYGTNGGGGGSSMRQFGGSGMGQNAYGSSVLQGLQTNQGRRVGG